MEGRTDEKIRELLAFAKDHGLSEVAYQENGVKISFRRNVNPHRTSAPKGAPPPSLSESDDKAIEEIARSPIVGTFRRSLSKDHPPLVLEGNHVKPGDRLGVVECMKIPTDVVSFSEGVIKKIMVEEGKAVEYGQPLFVIAPTRQAVSEEKE